MDFIFSCCLFFTSFLPLWISVVFLEIKSIVENVPTNIVTEILCLIFILVCGIASAVIIPKQLRVLSKENTMKYELVSLKEEKTLSAEYLLSYILPLFAFDFTIWYDVVLFCVYYITLGFLCIKHNHFSANIVLELAGIRTYSCILKDSSLNIKEIQVLSRGKLNAKIGDYLIIKDINNDIGLDVNLS